MPELRGLPRVGHVPELRGLPRIHARTNHGHIRRPCRPSPPNGGLTWLIARPVRYRPRPTRRIVRPRTSGRPFPRPITRTPTKTERTGRTRRPSRTRPTSPRPASTRPTSARTSGARPSRAQLGGVRWRGVRHGRPRQAKPGPRRLRRRDHRAARRPRALRPTRPPGLLTTERHVLRPTGNVLSSRGRPLRSLRPGSRLSPRRLLSLGRILGASWGVMSLHRSIRPC
ncbi:hypothetical protein SAMN04489716_7266 [Actinoplanes derwentensis]|uniref:Uncharacterized protein n=1 Tax=Actinoplanes derwentensis TaxID=113562 RepID=A0A1H2CZ26_9ACTN|nr:hypothetical protein SAMN04489716_7266 [Actinoplanes derwentensis]